MAKKNKRKLKVPKEPGRVGNPKRGSRRSKNSPKGKGKGAI